MTSDFLIGYTGDQVVAQPSCQIGIAYNESARPVEFKGKATIRSNTVIYGDVFAGENFQTGHGVLVRENTRIGDHVVLGTNTVVDGNVQIGNFVKIESNCYICTHVSIGDRVFLGPNVVLTNDRIPLKQRAQYVPIGPTIESGVTLGAGVILLPGVTVGEDSFVAAGTIVTKDVPPKSFVIGSPGEIKPLPEALDERNMALSWMKCLKS